MVLQSMHFYLYCELLRLSGHLQRRLSLPQPQGQSMVQEIWFVWFSMPLLSQASIEVVNSKSGVILANPLSSSTLVCRFQ